MNIRVIGCGNVIAGDDGVGLMVIEELKKLSLPSVEIIEGGVFGLDLLDYFLDTDKVIVVDAVSTGNIKGGLCRIEKKDIEAMSRDNIISLHQLGIAEVMKIGSILYSDRMAENIILIGIEIGQLEDKFSLELSPSVKKTVPLAVEHVLKEIGKLEN
jgi:hydrogenase maturation protease